MKKMKVGILVNGLTVSKYTYDFIKELSQDNNYLEIVLIEIGHSSVKESFLNRNWIGNSILKKIFNLFESFFRAFLLRLISKFEIFIARKSYKDYYKSSSLKSLNLRSIRLDSIWSASGFVVRIIEKSLINLESENFDVLIRANSGILKGKIIQAAKHGILSFHLGDNRVNRGGPPRILGGPE